MCRLAFFPQGTNIEQEKMVSFLTQLESSFGGDGNGYAAVSSSGGVIINKGLKLTCEEIAKEITDLLQNGWSVYFHTRKTSIGFNSDEQCHPFQIKGKAWSGSLCHNGTWQDGKILAKYFDVGSDTAAVAQMVGELGTKEMEKRKVFPSSGVFLLYGSEPGNTPSHTAIKMSGSLKYCPTTKIWASEFFKDWDYYKDVYEVKTGTWNLTGDAPEKTFVTSYSGYNSHNNHTPYRGNTYYYGSNVDTDVITDDEAKDLEDIIKNSEEDTYGDRIWYHSNYCN